MKKLFSLIDTINEKTGRAVSYLVILMTLVILYEIAARHLFNRPTIWAHETVQIIYGAYIVLLGGYVLMQGAHVNVDIVYLRFRPRMRALIYVLTWPLFFGFVGVLLVKGGISGIESLLIGETAPTTFGPPVWITKLLLPLGAALMLLQGLTMYIKNLIFLITGKEVAS